MKTVVSEPRSVPGSRRRATRPAADLLLSFSPSAVKAALRSSATHNSPTIFFVNSEVLNLGSGMDQGGCNGLQQNKTARGIVS